MKLILAKINISQKSEVAHLGSIVETDFANYFLSISKGKIIIEDKIYFAISVSSPIGKLLLGKKNNDKFVFNGKTFQIKKII